MTDLIHLFASHDPANKKFPQYKLSVQSREPGAPLVVNKDYDKWEVINPIDRLLNIVRYKIQGANLFLDFKDGNLVLNSDKDQLSSYWLLAKGLEVNSTFLIINFFTLHRGVADTLNVDTCGSIEIRTRRVQIGEGRNSYEILHSSSHLEEDFKYIYIHAKIFIIMISVTLERENEKRQEAALPATHKPLVK